MKIIAFAMMLSSFPIFAQSLTCIAGGSGSGKSTYARKIQSELGSKVVILELDRYYVEHPGTLEERKQFNWDHPSAIDWDLVKEHLNRLKSGSSVEVPVRDFMSFSRAPHSDTLLPSDYVVFEGIHALHHEDVRAICDRMIFVDTPEEVRLDRRIKRDAIERNRTPEETRQVFAETVKPMHDEFIEVVKYYPGVMVVDSRPID